MSDELIYVSWGGTGRGTTLRMAMKRAAANSHGLLYLAVLDDASFADLDDKFLGVVESELEWLLDAQLEVTKTQLGLDDLPVRVIIRRGEVDDQVSEVVNALGETEVLIGAPVPLAGHESVDTLLDQISDRTGVTVSLVSSAEEPSTR